MDPIPVSREHAIEYARLRRLFVENPDGAAQWAQWQEDFLYKDPFVPGAPDVTANNIGHLGFVLKLKHAIEISALPMVVIEEEQAVA